MNKFEALKSACEVLVNNLELDVSVMKASDYMTYINEYRTVSLNVPRRSGKSTILREIAGEYSSMLFLNHRFNKNRDTNVAFYHNMVDKLKSFVGVYNTVGMKYQCFLLDEPDSMTQEEKKNFYELVERYYLNDLLSRDFYILKLGTARVWHIK